ncbi:hypothetical protein [Mesorhizobium sp. CA16]|uniref:hypothetical protein n=1 Tax=Mesorhizobium sp. CA16 TaxID=588496 RepID=UPI001CCEE20D|nr:hypothetical protein [Mesorhizobium sp. CA16]MBZ9910997.1 hypothetical protein [Mesorhizobium sp. CA16]
MNRKRYKLSGAINPRGTGPSVCVPAFSSTSDNYTYVQYVGIDDTVILFELAELSEWEPVRGSPKAKLVDPGHPAIHWVTWSDDLQSSVVDTVEVVRADVIAKRWLVDGLDNPFERLDFAQLSGVYTWFAEEAERCETSLSEVERKSWLGDTLLLSRARFAVDSVLLAQSAPAAIRRQLALRLRAANAVSLIKSVEDLCKRYAPNYITDDKLKAIKDFLSNDVAYKYANLRLYGHSRQTASRLTAKRWYKKLTISDAQRKRSGNQRGGITLVAAGFPIDTQTYFRREFFGDVDWVKGKTRTGKELETASVRMKTTVLNNDMGVLSFNVTYAPNRQAQQANYTSILHLGPLAHSFSSRNMANKWLLLERSSDGSFSLSISAKEPE